MYPCEKLSLDNSLIDVIGNFFFKFRLAWSVIFVWSDSSH